MAVRVRARTLDGDSQPVVPVRRVRARSATGANDNGGGSYFAAPAADVDFFSTGCKVLDLSIGGGWAEGRVCNVVGDKSTGKTLLMIEAAANFAIKYPRGKIKYKECESAFDKGYAATLGMPVDRVDFGEDYPLETVEDMFEDLDRDIKKQLQVKPQNRQPMLYIVDSLDALSDRNELDRAIDEKSFGMQKAKQLSQLFRRLVRKITEARITVMIVSQVRDRIAVMAGRKFMRTGGRALDFYASQVIWLSQIQTIVKTINNVKRPIAIKIHAKNSKNKVGIPLREAKFEIRFGYGIDDLVACIEWLREIKYKLPDEGKVPPDVKSYVRSLDTDMNKFREAVAYWHGVVHDAWYGLEAKFLPVRRKYEQLGTDK